MKTTSKHGCKPWLSIFNYFILCILLFHSNLGPAQTQLEIQGHPNSTDTVARINVNFSGVSEVVGLAVHSRPGPTLG
ncbi:MAG: hypothetical protein KDC80_05915, partial [Saprospiraceae bacterium]|nr:hypothetical protein [Saprospiraceae bacterium]